MASTTGIRAASPQPGGPGQPGPPAGQEQGAALGLVSATGLVMGSMIGVGVFTMPAVLAEAGTSSLVVMAVVAAGAMLLAVLFGQLTRRVPNAGGAAGCRAGYWPGTCHLWRQRAVLLVGHLRLRLPRPSTRR